MHAITLAMTLFVLALGAVAAPLEPVVSFPMPAYGQREQSSVAEDGAATEKREERDAEWVSRPIRGYMI